MRRKPGFPRRYERVRTTRSVIVAALAVVQLGTDRPGDIEQLYAMLSAERGERAFAASDYDHQVRIVERGAITGTHPA